MTIHELLDLLEEKRIQIHEDEGELVVRAPRGAMDAALAASLRQKKGELLVELQRRERTSPVKDARITPEMLTLLSLDQAAIDAIVATVEGGAANVQDIYPLAPLQEGMLFHHLLNPDNDVYTEGNLLAFRSRSALDSFLSALQQVIDRHDILRTGIVWEGLEQPVQVVRRRVKLPMELVELDARHGEIARQLEARYDPRHYRLDIRRAPLLSCHAARDESNDRWLLRIFTHHLAIDHVALDLLINEVRAIQQGLLAQLPPPAPFRNFVAQALLGVSQQEHEAFFTRMLGDIEEPTAPFGLLDVQGDGHSIAEARLTLLPALSQAVRRQARGLGVTPASLMHLAWALVLARVTGRRQVVFGTVLFGRMQGGRGADRMLGLLMNTLPICISVGEQGVEHCLRSTHALLAQLLRHEHAPLVLAQRCSGVPAQTPLFTSLLNYRYGPLSTESRELRAAAADEEVELISQQVRNNYPLTLAIDDFGQDFSLTVQVCEPVHPQRVCAFMQTALENLLRSLQDTPDRLTSRIDVLPAAERQQVLVAWNDTCAEYPRQQCVHELFAVQAGRMPDSVAVVFEGRELTYGDLDKRSNQLAHHLRTLGVGPDAIVGLCVERSPEMVIGLLGILKAGGAYLPLDPSYPPERLEYMISDARASVLLTHGASNTVLPENNVRKVRLDADCAELVRQPVRSPVTGVRSDNLAYVIYTSGSTGKPKGVMVEHRRIVNYIWGIRDALHLEEHFSYLAVQPLSVDSSVTTLYGALLLSGVLHIVSYETSLAPGLLAEYCARHRIDCLKIAPPHLQALLDSREPARILPKKRLIVGGDVSHWEWVDRLTRDAPACRIFNHYGPTEATVGTTVYAVAGGGERGSTGAVPIGRPLHNSRVYVLDEQMEPVPIGAVGDLYLGGETLARGYLGRPGLTAESFVPDPFALVAGQRLYRTGDRARFLTDGNLEFLGRADEQVKIRGHRIEPEEIASVLLENAAVRQAVVIASSRDKGEPQLVAYVVLNSDVRTTPAELHRHLAGRLPAQMVPAAVIVLESLPRTAHGKLDRRALPALQGSSEIRAYRAPRTPTEEAVAAIWSEVLKVGRLGIDDNFFELGGHSLLATRVMARLRELFEMDLPLRALFDAPTVREFGERIEAARRAGTGVSIPELTRQARTGELPLSYAQERLWFLEQMEGLGGTYNLPAAVRLQGMLDVRALERSFEEVVRRHESLRTHFELANGRGVQVVDPPGKIELEVVDLAGHDLGQRETAARELAREDAQRGFDLRTGPLLRAKLVRLSATEQVIVVNMHHIVSDGWSMAVLIREIGALYAAFREGRPSPLAEPQVQYADYTLWQRGWLQGETLERQLGYWRECLRGAPAALELPTDRVRPAVQSFRGASYDFSLSRELSEGLSALARRAGATLFMVLLAGFSVLLGRWSGQSDIVVGSPIAGRGRRELEGLIGFFVNVLVLRTSLAGNPGFREVLRRVKETALGAYAHQDLPFERLVNELRPAPDLSRQPVFQVDFTFQNVPLETITLPGLQPARLESEQVTAKCDLSLYVQEEPTGLQCSFEYATDLFDAGTIERLAGYFERLLAGIVAAPDGVIGDFELLSEAQRRQLLVEWNDTEAEYPHQLCVHELFESQVERTPEATAVLHDGERLSYAQLNEQANQLAHHLRALGVGPETVVGLCLERSPRMLVGMLGILKAGGAYLPLDPDYPADRLGYLINDVMITVLITEAALVERLPSQYLRLVEIDTDWPSIAGQPTSSPDSGARPDNLAYIIYTSGSTGTPKGVMVEHRGVVNLAQAQIALFGARGSSRVMQFASLSFDASVFEIMMALGSGGALLLPTREQRQADAVLDYLAENAATHATLPPALLTAPPQGEIGASLETVVLAGEAPGVSLIQAFSPHVKVFNAYGPTEATVWATTWLRPPAFDGVTVPMGRPIANARLYVLDEYREPVPLGTVGEIYIGGVGVARGYWNRPELTAERFLIDPFRTEPGARMYRTGDLARYRSDGQLEFVGRSDQQVKIRGFRVELGEIETRLMEYPGVREAVVITSDDVSGNPRLVAYFSLHPDSVVETAALRGHLARLLPEHMIPAAFVELAQLPLTSNSKVDRKSLPAPDAQAIVQAAYDPPDGALEQTLARIWSELLGIERVGRHDHFFQLGGHSLLAVTLIERMRAEGMHADVRTVFTAPTLAALAAQLGTGGEEVQVPPNLIPADAPRITPEMLTLVDLTQEAIDSIVATVQGGAANVQDIYPLAPLQEGMLFHHLLSPDHDAYVESHLLAFPTRERLDRFLRVLQQIIDRHDILRTGIVWEALNEPVQVVRRQVDLRVEFVELGAGQGDVAGRLAALFDPRCYRLDIAQAPLLHCYATYDGGFRGRQGTGRWLLCVLSHHLVIDHTTLELFSREARAIEHGRLAELAQPAPFRNFIAQARLGVGREEHEAFFKQILGDIEETTAPFGLLDVRGDGRGVAEARQMLPAQLSQAIRKNSRKLGLSAASLMHLAWGLVLARTSGRCDVAFGTVLFGRMQGGARADQVLGMFINTLPVRIVIGDGDVEEDWRKTHELLVQLLRHEHAPLSLAQRCSGVPAQAPLFTSLLNYRYQTADVPQPPASGDDSEEIEVLSARERTNYPLTMSVDDLGQDFCLVAQVVGSVSPERVCAYMQTALEHLTEALQDTPARPTRSIDVLPLAESHMMLVEWNETAREYPRDSCIHELFEAQVERTPDAVAVVCEGNPLSYGELNARANCLAGYLRERGVRPGRAVALDLERSAELIVAQLAILKCGAVYVPLDENAPLQRKGFMLADCDAGVVLSVRGHDLPTISGIERIDLDQLDLYPYTTLEPGSASVRRKGSDIAYVMYTSGSTGQPKGVEVPHRAIARLVINNGYLTPGPGERIAFAANPAFDASTFEVWGALLNGASVVVISKFGLLETAALGEALLRDRVGVLFVTTALFNQLVRSGASLGGLRWLLFGGEACDARLVREALQSYPALRVLHVYGPTETTTFASYYPVEFVGEAARSVPIGRPIGNTRFYLLDQHHHPVPVGVVGEIYIGGAGVARGYLNRPELTAQCFVEDPFSEEADARMYRTGDLGRYLADGNIEYVGRNDSQVKIRGFRIELEEIEARLSEAEGVREAVVVARADNAASDSNGDRRLVAYYTGELLSADDLREHVLSALPQYMVPAAYVHLDRLPVTPNGKLDRKALPAPEGESYASRMYEEPQDEIERKLAGLWSELLRVERVGRQDNFFELGGHSLLAVQLVSRIRQRLHVEVGLSELFEAPGLAAFAQRVRARAPAPLEQIERVTREGTQLLSLAQQRLWFLSRMEAASAAYHIRGAVLLSGELNREALRRALQGIVRRHEALRTCFCLVDGEPRQQILQADEVSVEVDERDVLDVADTVEKSACDEVQRYLAEHAQAPFDLERDLPMRVLLLRLGEREWLLQVVMHHIASDGWSIGIFHNELSELYGAYVRGEADPLAPLKIQYADYAAWQRRQAVSALQRQSEFWRENLHGAPLLLELPTDRARPERQDYAGASVEVSLEGALSEAVKALSRRHGVTLYMTLLASWAVLLARLSGQREVVIGSPVAGRNHADVEVLIGCFVNTLALRVDVSGELSVTQLLERVRDQVLAAQRHQDLPFEQVVEVVQPPRSLAHTPLFQVMFDWQNTPAGELRMPGLRLRPLDAPASTAQFDLSLSLGEGPAGIAGKLNYATALFDRDTAQRYASYWICLLQSLSVAREDDPIDRLNLLPEAERQQLLFGWNDTVRPRAQQWCVHELFEAQVKRTPEATAVWQDGQRLSYAQLNRQANRLAHYLRALGVGPDRRVAVCLQRGREMVIGLLAILKAGGAYVPLDPDYPSERIAYMLSDSAPVAVLTTGPARAVLADSRSMDDTIPVLDLEDDATRWSHMPDHDSGGQAVGLTAEHLAYVIYTSGSTGVPKGVMIEHRGLVNYTLEAIRWFEMDDRDTVLQQNSLNFDLSIEETLPALLSGATLMPSARLFGMLDSWRDGQDGLLKQPSVVHLTAAHWHSLVAEWSESGAPVQTMLEGVRLINVTGDALSEHRLEQWGAIKPERTRLINTYGPTETTVSCTATYLGEDSHPSRVTIGRPFANTRLYILDPRMQPVPMGVTGELYIGGVQVGRGYLNQPRLTRERFIADPFVSGGRLYRTGDLGRWLADGSIQFVGRNDFQVKLRGFRVELGEIEAHLARLDGVREALAIVREDAAGELRLVAYYTGVLLPAEALREHAMSGLPQYMVPAAYVHLDALPLTPNGKLDRKAALPAPAEESYASRTYEEPVGEIEQRLARLWSQLLKVERVGRHDNFFELGGHSLLGISLIERMRRESLHADLTVLFSAPTLADMASATVKLKEIVL